MGNENDCSGPAVLLSARAAGSWLAAIATWGTSEKERTMGAEGTSRRWRWPSGLIIVHLSEAESRSCATPVPAPPDLNTYMLHGRDALLAPRAQLEHLASGADNDMLYHPSSLIGSNPTSSEVLRVSD